jgi:HPt (histidine-containing phosphotransfer) domain-containing protein
MKEILLSSPPWSDSGVQQEFEQALHRIGGNKTLYLNMANMFAQSAATMSAQLQGYLRCDEKQNAARLLHTLQGTAGAVGAKQLADYALQVERQLRIGGGADVPAFSVNEFDAFMRQSCNALLAYSNTLKPRATRPVNTSAEIDRPTIARLLDELDALMREKNMRATTLFEEIRTAFGAALGEKLMALERAIGDLDFPLSLERTRSLREAMN